MQLSILIPTLASRAASFARITTRLEAQIRTEDAAGEVEIVSLADGGEMPVGAKRNRLMARAQGAHLVSVDDDDDVSDDYIGRILAHLREAPDVDCLSIRGRMSFPTGQSQGFHYSMRYRSYRTIDGVMTRPPHHLNPIRAEIARRFPYEEVRAHEDSDVALRMVRAGALQSERSIDAEIYRYASRRDYRWHCALALTEPLRHPLGIKKRNVLRLRRVVRSMLTPRG